ncbi:MAG: hypothetical protein GY898_31755 [Proteobacteria bacterium]|nr:hypothetical protein [Pseudomonadota bacterium]
MRRLLLMLLVLVGCGPKEPALTSEELLDPEACADCHQEHYRQWSGSMHAYAAEDPVFVAMNERGQEETDGDLGTFCIQCHAPMAVELGLTDDGLNMDEVPDMLEGVTCAFCHRVEEVTADHNKGLTLSDEDDLLRGGIADPVETGAHRSAYSPLHDRGDAQSSDLCGSCHDLVSPNGVHLERTYLEWTESVFGMGGVSQLTCGNCHMRGSDGPAVNTEGAPIRRVHDHSMPGVDIAITDWPEREAQLELVQESLDGTLIGSVCVNPNAGLFDIQVTLENAGAGHAWPSGAAADRRAWVELKAYDAAGTEIFTSGVVGDTEPIAELVDPWLWLLRDTMTDANGDEVHMFWEATDSESDLLPPSVTFDATSPDFIHWVQRTYTVVAGQPARVEARVRLRPMGLEILQSLVDSGDLAEEHLSEFPTFDLGSVTMVWDGPLGSCTDD